MTYRHRVRYHEADAQGVVFNSRYLEFADVAMTEFFRELGWPYLDLLDAGVDPSVVRAEIDFTAPARFDDILDLEVTCTHVGRSSFVLRTTVRRGTEALATMMLTYVNVDTAVAASRPLPQPVAAALRAAAAESL